MGPTCSALARICFRPNLEVIGPLRVLLSGAMVMLNLQPGTHAFGISKSHGFEQCGWVWNHCMSIIPRLARLIIYFGHSLPYLLCRAFISACFISILVA